jgi:hypothetical protein
MWRLEDPHPLDIPSRIAGICESIRNRLFFLQTGWRDNGLGLASVL